MIYWYTGQPGHGKTLHAIDHLLRFKEKGRAVYACNVRQFDYEKTGVLPMTPEQFRDWMNFLPDGAVALVDEAYEHDMLPKRPPGAKVPAHVEQLAKHRHRGLDFIFVSQSPDKQCDQFVHDLIERHVHVRRLFGSNMVQLREFDKFQANAEKATPIISRRVHLLKGKRSVGTYQSTEMDTTEKRVPWYYYAFFIGIPVGVLLFWYVFGDMAGRLGGEPAKAAFATQSPPIRPDAMVDNGASATVSTTRSQTAEEYVASFTPRVPSQPWSAPAYDGRLSVSSQPPRIFCVKSDPGGYDALGRYRDNGSCSCLTEQGTRYALDHGSCAIIARYGQYEPFFDEQAQDRRVDGYRQQEMILAERRGAVADTIGGHAGTAPQPMVSPEFGTITRSAP